MLNAIPRSASNRSLSLCYADIPNKMVTSAIDTIISRMAPAYLELMREAKENPEIISDYKSSLSGYYKGIILSPELETTVMEAQEMVSECKVVTKTLPSNSRISVFSEKNSEFDENQALGKARVYIKLRVNAKDIKEEDPLDLLLSQLSKKILSQGYGDEGTFDIRLERGCLLLEGDPWKWHYDGELFKTSISVCYSNKENWSTRVSDSRMESNGRPADHGFLYDALNVYHRAPIPSDLKGEELNADDYRLFIRYNEFYKNGERTFADRGVAEKKKEKIFSLHSDYKLIPINTELESLLSIKQSSITALPNLLDSQYANHLNNSKLIEGAFAKYSENLLTPITLENVPEYNLSELLKELVICEAMNSSESTPTNNVLPIASEMEDTPHQERNNSFECIVM